MESDKDLATKARKLRAGAAPWAKRGRPNHPLSKSIRVEIVVVGAGVTGAFVAEALSHHYSNVLVVDRRSPAAGSTSASTAMLQWEIDTPLVKLKTKIGSSKANRAWRRSYKATQDLMRLVEDQGIRCGLSERNSLYLAGNDAGHIKLAEETMARRHIGLPSEYVNHARVRDAFGIDRTGAIVSKRSAIADPVSLTRGLLGRAARNGAQVRFPVEIRNVLATKHGVILDTGHHFIEARHCIFCTGYELLKAIPQKNIKITSTWAIATRAHTAHPPWLHKYVMWEAADPYLYMRTTPDHRLVIGGEDEDIELASYRERKLSAKARALETKSGRLLTQRIRASTVWTGAFGESADGLPIIDAVPDMPNCFVAAGLGGNGTIYAMIAAQIIPTLLRGKPDKDAALYQFR